MKTFFEEVGEGKDDGLISTQNQKVDPRCLSVIIHGFHILNLCVDAPFLPCHCTIVWGRKGAWQRGGDSLAGFCRRVRCTFPLHFNSRPYIATLFCFPEPERGPPGLRACGHARIFLILGLLVSFILSFFAFRWLYSFESCLTSLPF